MTARRVAAVVVHPVARGNPALVAMMIFLANVQISTADLLCEGKYSELMRESPESK